MKAHGIKADRVTTISFNDASDEVAIVTRSASVWRKLIKLGYRAVEDENEAVFIVPKTDLKLPRHRKPLSEARKAELAVHAKSIGLAARRKAMV